MSADSTSPTPERLQGLDLGRVMGLGLEDDSSSSPRDSFSVPSPEELAQLLPDYEIQSIIGRGGMGAVYGAIQKQLNRPVAIKVLPISLGDTPGFAARFRQEAQAMASLNHPNIVAVYDSGETIAGHYYYVMEMIPGMDLAQKLELERLTTDAAVQLVAALCGALAFAHQSGVIHRDLKPSNILLTTDGSPKLADFGLALLMEKNLELSRLTMGGTTLGTLEYAAPEQLHHGLISPSTDLYSLGVLLYELLTGELPRGIFDPPSVRNSEVDPAFDGVVLRALQSDPDRRFATASDFRQALLQAADRRHQQNARDLVVRRKMARRARLALVSTGIALLTGGSAIYAWRAEQVARERSVAATKAETKTDDLMQFLLTDLRRRLEPTGNLGAMESTLERAVEHYRENYELTGRTTAAATKLADVLVVKGDVIGVRGMDDAADKLYTEALEVLQRARHKDSTNFTLALRITNAFKDRSEHRMAQGHFTDALEDARRMLQSTTEFPPQQSATAAKLAQAESHRAIANALGYTKDFDAGREEYLTSKTLFSELAAGWPEQAFYKNELAALEMSLGSLAEAVNDYPAMLQHFTAYNEFVKQRYGPTHQLYSYSSFRMGVAMIKSQRPAEAIPYLKDAIELAEPMLVREPGHKGILNHLSWCLKLMAEALEADGQAEEAQPFRKREAATNALLAAKPATSTAFEPEFQKLNEGSPAHNEWWSFCQRLQASVEPEKDPKLRQEAYQKFLEHVQNATANQRQGNLVHTVTAFIHNRLAGLLLANDPASSAQHAMTAMKLRQALVEAHPGDPILERNVLSSAAHWLRAAVQGDTPAMVIEAAPSFAKAAQLLSPAALIEKGQGISFATDAASLLAVAVVRFPDLRAELSTTASAISAALLDRLPEESQPHAQPLKQRLLNLKR
jgi:serine/threonine protein kinase